MKNNRKSHNHQRCQNRQYQQRDNADRLNVTISRGEYDELLYSSALVGILHRLYKASGKYAMADLMESIFIDADNEKEDE